MPDHRINIRKEKGKFVLYNHDAICGQRLYKGDGDTLASRWPFDSEDWMRHHTEAAAVSAKKKLVAYLDKAEKRLGKN